MLHFYQIYGLVVASEVKLPELIACPQARADVEIRLGSVPAYLPGSVEKRSWIDHVQGRCLMRIESVGRMLIEQGRRIVIDPGLRKHVQVGPELHADLRLYLLGSAFAALLHQRGLLPIHVSAVSTPLGVVGFTGSSGAGKSTIAGLLNQQMGFPLVSDDVAVVDFGTSDVHLLPGPRKLKLWEDALEFLQFENELAVQDLSNTAKFQLYLRESTPPPNCAFRSLILLEESAIGEAPDLIPVMGIERFRICCNAVYRHHMVPWFRLRESYMSDVFRFSETIKVFRWRRPRSLEAMAAQTEYLWQLLSEIQPDMATGT